MLHRTFALLLLVAAGCAGSSRATTTPAAPAPAYQAGDPIDCARLSDPTYRAQVEAAGTDPDSIDCTETE